MAPPRGRLVAQKAVAGPRRRVVEPGAVDDKEVEPAVVVVVEELGAPANIRQARRGGSGSEGHVDKVLAAFVAVEDVVLLGEVAHEQVQMTVVAKIAHGHAHAPLLTAVLADRDPERKRDLLERAVAEVAVEKVRVCVVRNE